METQYLTPDYRSSMQQAALAYLQRHDPEYLTGSDLLFERCVRHLSIALEVPVFMAQKLVQHAWVDLQVIKQRQYLCVDWGRGADRSVVHLVDTRVDLRYPVPARLLPQKMLDRRVPPPKLHPL